FHGENGEQHGVGIVNVEHESGDQSENQPLRERSRGARLVPIPEEKGHRERGMRVGPRWIEIHIDRQRAGPPDRERGQKRPALFHILAREAERQNQAQESVERGGQRHGDAIRSGKAIGGDRGREIACEQYRPMSNEKKRRPENRRAYGEMILKMSGGRSKIGPGLVAFIEARPAETFVGVLIVLGEIETVLDERSADKSIVAHAIAAHPGVQKRERAQKEKKKPALRLARAMRRR